MAAITYEIIQLVSAGIKREYIAHFKIIVRICCAPVSEFGKF